MNLSYLISYDLVYYINLIYDKYLSLLIIKDRKCWMYCEFIKTLNLKAINISDYKGYAKIKIIHRRSFEYLSLGSHISSYSIVY